MLGEPSTGLDEHHRDDNERNYGINTACACGAAGVGSSWGWFFCLLLGWWRRQALWGCIFFFRRGKECCTDRMGAAWIRRERAVSERAGEMRGSIVYPERRGRRVACVSRESCRASGCPRICIQCAQCISVVAETVMILMKNDTQKLLKHVMSSASCRRPSGPRARTRTAARASRRSDRLVLARATAAVDQAAEAAGAVRPPRGCGTTAAAAAAAAAAAVAAAAAAAAAAAEQVAAVKMTPSILRRRSV